MALFVGFDMTSNLARVLTRRVLLFFARPTRVVNSLRETNEITNALTLKAPIEE